jgi:ketopantoate hydroxymethyltransferase
LIIKLLEKLGCALVLEKYLHTWQKKWLKHFDSVIGIGAGGGVDGRIFFDP